MNLEGEEDRNSQFIKDEGGDLLREMKLIHEPRVQWFHILLKTESPKASNIVGTRIRRREFNQRGDN